MDTFTPTTSEPSAALLNSVEAFLRNGHPQLHDPAPPAFIGMVTVSSQVEADGAALAQEAQAGKSMVIVTHKPALLPLATRIVVVVGNKIVLDGPRDAVLQQLQQGQAQTQQAQPSASSAQQAASANDTAVTA